MSALESLQVSSALSYLIALVIPALDAIFPVLPSETAIIALGTATAGSADPRIVLLVGCAAAGAFIGDNLCYLLGSRFGPAVQRRFFTTPKGMRARAWAERSLERFGMQLIVVCRFIPGGRTAVTLTCGFTGYPRRRFTIATAVAAVIWALYSFLIGRIGGRAFEDNLWAGLVVALSASIAITTVIEVVRRLWARIRGRASAVAARPTTQRHSGQAEPYHADQDQGNQDGLHRRDRIAEEDHAGRRRPHGANPGPDRVGGPVRQLKQHYGQQPQMETASIGSSRGTNRPCTPAGEPEFREP
jgi:membrane protein DedA with SNARE-associated domain